MFKEWTVPGYLTMKGKSSILIVLIIIAGLVIVGVLSENDGATVTKVKTPIETESQAAEGDQTNIPVDPGGLQHDLLRGTTKDTEGVGTEDELDVWKEAVVETTKDEEESKQRSDNSDTEKNSKEAIPSTLTDDSPSETATAANEDGPKTEQERDSVKPGEELEPKSDDQTSPPVNKETEDLHVSEDIPVSPEVPDSEVVDTSPEVESTDTNKSEEKMDDEPVHVDPEFQTFTEFFEQNKQAEEEKKKQSKLADIPGTEVLQMKQQKRVVNVASKECGAKIISSNPEVENPGGVLTSNKDDYMINPCKAAKKWFVIELCEPARVKSLEVASFELFSSQPRTFRVQFSEGYPTKDWQVMEPFSATEARVIQTFTVPEDFNDYVKFIRVEMLDHFGEEHFCPLTIFRVLGVLVEYDAYMGQQIDDTASGLLNQLW
ncbi:SUN domain-containing ossification factor-like [Pecten maximus]|uniref:SUN domain-containing ossification factor-like n=1 Tax=Pecten maximus TaxID=6579 RepID=UPI0014585888|nr:SUN domain-containing ossification factor-like [Pecten maximus]